MARPKGSKNKSTEQKLAAVAEELAEIHAEETVEEVKAEIAEAVEEVIDILEKKVEVNTLKFPNGSTVDVNASGETELKGIFVGYHPITKEPVYL